jgi:hypothetical protein
MKTSLKLMLVVTAAGASLVSGCSSQSVSSTARRAGALALGAVGGGLAGHMMNPNNPSAGVIGAVAGTAVTGFALGEDESVRQEGFDAGYVHGQSDAIKRQYFLRRALEEKPPSSAGGETVFYMVPGPETTVDGRKLEPHQVAIRVVE